jgi:hypothetical protein
VGDLQRQVAAVPAPQHLAGVVAAGVVDDVDRVGPAALRRQPVEHAGQQVGPVVRDDHDGHGLVLAGHGRYLA